MIEIWKPVPEYEGLYEVSNFGFVRSLDRTVLQKNAFGTISEHFYRGRNMKMRKSSNGYLYFSVNDRDRKKSLKPHRLVALLFVDNPLGLPEVNHKDGDKTNNRFDNLEWVTSSENKQHALKSELMVMRTGYESNAVNTKIQIFKNGILVDEVFGEMALKERGFTSSGVCSVVNGRQKTHRSHTFKRIKIEKK